MRKLTILFALFCISTCWGQRKVILDSIQKFINARIDDPKIKAPIDEFFTNYLSSKPIQENELWENKVGICIDVLVQKNSVIYYPAKFDINYINIITFASKKSTITFILNKNIPCIDFRFLGFIV